MPDHHLVLLAVILVRRHTHRDVMLMLLIHRRHHVQGRRPVLMLVVEVVGTAPSHPHVLTLVVWMHRMHPLLLVLQGLKIVLA